MFTSDLELLPARWNMGRVARSSPQKRLSQLQKLAGEAAPS